MLINMLLHKKMKTQQAKPFASSSSYCFLNFLSLREMASLNHVHGFLLLLLGISFALVHADDPSPLQDFCVADPESHVFVNGVVCKDPKKVTEMDFFLSGLDKPGNTNNRLGSQVTFGTAAQIPGLNTLGLSMVRLDYAPWGLIPPHIHGRASEILVVLQGSLYVGFVTSNPNNTFFAKTLVPGDVFVFPPGLIHFEFNVGNTSAVAIAALNSQNPGVTTIGNTVFGSKPPIFDEVLAKAFQVDKYLVDHLQSLAWMG